MSAESSVAPMSVLVSHQVSQGRHLTASNPRIPTKLDSFIYIYVILGVLGGVGGRLVSHRPKRGDTNGRHSGIDNRSHYEAVLR